MVAFIQVDAFRMNLDDIMLWQVMPCLLSFFGVPGLAFRVFSALSEKGTPNMYRNYSKCMKIEVARSCKFFN